MSKRTKIVIVGGGSAGWLTAGYLSKFHSDCDIELIESETVPTIGVGESVTPHVDFFLKEMACEGRIKIPRLSSISLSIQKT